jgi:hypothetical protein
MSERVLARGVGSAHREEIRHMPAKDAVALLNAEHLFEKDENVRLNKAGIVRRVCSKLQSSR